MLKKYNFEKASKNPYITEMAHLLSSNVDELVTEYMQKQANELKIPYDVLTNIYVTENQKKEHHKEKEGSKKKGLYR